MTMDIFRKHRNKVFKSDKSAELQRIEEEIHALQKSQALLRNGIHQIIRGVTLLCSNCAEKFLDEMLELWIAGGHDPDVRESGYSKEKN